MKKSIKAVVCFLLTWLLGMTLLCSCQWSSSSWTVSTGTVYANADKYSVGDADIGGQVERIVINWGAGEVAFSYYQGQEIQLKETVVGSTATSLAPELQLHYWLDGTTLRVQCEASGEKLFDVIPKKELTVTLPQSLALKELIVSTASADVRGTDLMSDSVRMDTASGNINVSFEDLQKADFDTASGSINATLQEADEVKLDSASGNIRLTAESDIDRLTVDTASGWVILNLATVQRLKVDSASGAVQVTAQDIREVEMDAASGKMQMDVTRVPERIDVDTASGDVMLVLPADAAFTARVDTGSGDFSCDFPTVYRDGVYICGSGGGEFRFDTASGDVSILKK